METFNNEQSVARSIFLVSQFFTSKRFSCEILVVDKGSRDRTLEIVSDFGARLNCDLKLAGKESESGKKGDMYRGAEVASGRSLLFLRPDLLIPVEEYEKLLQALQSGAAVAVGVETDEPCEGTGRRKALSFVSFLVGRHAAGEVFSPGWRPRAFSAAAFSRILPYARTTGSALDAEMLSHAERFGYTPVEVPLAFRFPVHAKKSFSAKWRLFLQLVRIRSKFLFLRRPA
jgi:dolichyl-phosphate beta-glucosyltransferase